MERNGTYSLSRGPRERRKEREEKDKGVNWEKKKNEEKKNLGSLKITTLFFFFLSTSSFFNNPKPTKKTSNDAAPDLLSLRRLQDARLLPLPRLRVRGRPRADQGDQGEGAAAKK